jgi:hypothetical protein
MLGYDAKKSCAMLIGTSRFMRDSDNLPNIPAVTANIIDLERLLRDPGVAGLPPEAVVRLLDEEDISAVAERIAAASRDTEDLFLLYYAGHGLISKTGDLLLTFTRSTQALADANCLHWSTIKSYILESPAKTKLVILDCCFSGRAFELMGAEVEALRQDLEVRGTVVLASSPRNEPSLAPLTERRTAFSDALLSTIEQGIDNQAVTVSVDEIFTLAKQKLRAAGAPEPQRLASADAEDVAIVRNRRSEFSKENSTFELLVGQIEARVNHFLDKRLGIESEVLNEERSIQDRPISYFGQLALTVFYASFVIGEVVWLFYLGSPRGGYDSVATAGSRFAAEHPNFTGFLWTALALLILSGAVIALATVALRSPNRSMVLSTFFPSRSWARTAARVGTLNLLIVTFTALVVPFFNP